MDIQELLKLTISRKASDLHLVFGYPPLIRVDGNLVNASNNILDENTLKGFVDTLLSPAQKEFLDVNKEIDFSYEYKESQDRFRINVFHQKGHLSFASAVLIS